MNNAVMRAQGYAVSMEHDMRRVFGCERFGFAGVVNSDFIRKNPLAAVLATCGFIYAEADDKNKKEIEAMSLSLHKICLVRYKQKTPDYSQQIGWCHFLKVKRLFYPRRI